MRELAPETAERDYVREPLTRREVAAIVDAAGAVGAVLNTRHALAKERGWKETPPAKAAFAAAVVETPNLLRRPVLVRGDRAVVGHDETAIREILRNS